MIWTGISYYGGSNLRVVSGNQDTGRYCKTL